MQKQNQEYFLLFLYVFQPLYCFLKQANFYDCLVIQDSYHLLLLEMEKIFRLLRREIEGVKAGNKQSCTFTFLMGCIKVGDGFG